MKRICVYAGSRPGIAPEYVAAAEALGIELANRGIGLVYGGASNGLMGRVADAVLDRGGEVIGVIPKGLFTNEVAHQGLTELHEVDNMHQRKALMHELSDAYISLPGGLGTFEELFETLCWVQIGILHKPLGLLNTNDFYTPIRQMIAHAVQAGFAYESALNLFILRDEPVELLDGLAGLHDPE